MAYLLFVDLTHPVFLKFKGYYSHCWAKVAKDSFICNFILRMSKGCSVIYFRVVDLANTIIFQSRRRRMESTCREAWHVLRRHPLPRQENFEPLRRCS